MSGSTLPRLDSLFVWTARYLVVVYLAAVILERIDALSVVSSVQLRVLFWATIAAGLGAAVVLYRPQVGRALAYATDQCERLSTPRAGRALSVATIVMATALVATLALATMGISVPVLPDVGVLYGLVAVLSSVTLLVRDDRTTTVAAKAGAAVLVVGLLLGRLFGFQNLGIESYALTGVLVGVTTWRERDRLQHRTLDFERFHERQYEIAIAILTAVAIVVYFHRLGFKHLHGDEHQVVAAAAGYYFTGEFHMWNWITSAPSPAVYDRAWPHTVLVATSYSLFGISEWSSRLPSAIAGVATVPVSYFVFLYFTERRGVAIATSTSLLLSPVFIDFFRWTRMYAILIPLFLLLTYLVYRVLTEENTLDLHDETVNALVERHANVNVGLGLITLPLLYIGIRTHRNTLFLLPAVYLFSIYQYSLTRERKYFVASVFGTVCLAVVALVVVFTDRLEYISSFLSFFARENYVYAEYVFGFPLQTALGAILFVTGFGILHLARDRTEREKLTFLYLLTSFSLLFLIFVGDRYSSYAYVVHVVPFGIALVLTGYRAFVTAFRSTTVRSVLVVLLLASLVVPLYGGAFGYEYRTLYYEDSQDFTTAYGTIIEHQEDGEAIFLQYPRRYYLRGLDPDTTMIDMESDRRYSPVEFSRDISTYESGWIAWETGKSSHIDPTIREYIDENFVKHHGSGVDDTGVEVYYFNGSMKADSQENGTGGLRPRS